MKRKLTKNDWNLRRIPLKSLSLFLLVSASLLGSFAQGQIVNNESFDAVTFPPAGWSGNAGNPSWTRVTAGTYPTQTPHSGAGEIKFNSWSYSGSRAFCSPAYSLATNTAGASVSFWMYRDAGYSSSPDRVEVYYNTAANLTGASLLGTVNRPLSYAPVVSAAGWYQYSYTIPASVTSSNVYLILNGISQYGNNIYVDDVSWTSYPVETPPVPVQSSGTPTCLAGTDLTATGTPQTGAAWYWQTSATGTSTAIPYTGAYTVLANGTYYLRSYFAASGAWSSSSSVDVTNFPTATAPPAGIAALDPSCVTTGSSLSAATPPAGTTYYWQGTTVGGSSTTLPATTPYAYTASGTYYIAALDAASGCWSNTVGTTVTVGTIIPPAPTANQNLTACSGVATLPLTATASGVSLTYTVNLADSWGDGWNGALLNVLVNGTSVLTGITLATGSSGSFNLSVTEGAIISTVWAANGSFPSECSYTITNQLGAVVASVGSGGGAITPYTVPLPVYTLNWYDAASAGNNIGSGSPLEAVGTSVMPTATLGTYNFYVSQFLTGCSSTLVNVTANIVDVNVALAPINETCTGYANGSFALGTISCGTAPFTYSIDGGTTFGAIPTDLAAGTYAVIVKDAINNSSASISVIIGTTSTVIPPSPSVTTNVVNVCTGSTSVPLNASGVSFDSLTLLTTMAAGNGYDANMFSITATNTATITGFAINANVGTGDYQIHYRADDYLLTPGSNTSATGWILVGNATGVASVPGTYTPVPIPVSVTIPAGSTYSFHVGQTNGPGIAYTNGTTLGAPYASDANITFNQGHGGAALNCTNGPRVFNGLISYEIGVTADVEWFDAATAGNNLGAGSPLEAVGTSVLPAVALGAYEFYVATELNGCYSIDRELITVNVVDVNVTLVPIDAICNGSGTGSFVLSFVDCGIAPFTYSVNGGAFGAVPTNLTAGTYSIVVKDALTNLSSAYTIVINESGAPSNLVMDTITDNGGQVSWVSNGSESSWFVEYGLPGFTPGTGNQVGLATVSDTFALFSGLDGNTDYDFYVSADCGAGQTVGDWTLITFTTECGIYGLPFVETFEDNSVTRRCWYNINEIGNADWTYQTGSNFGTVTTAFEGVKNARFIGSFPTGDVTKLASPRFDFVGQDSVAIVFAYAQGAWGADQNTTKVFVTGPSQIWTEIASYTTNVSSWTIDTLFVSDTVTQVAFEGTNNYGYANVVDDVQIEPCTLTPGTNGTSDVCRLENTFDLNSAITQGETFGSWIFPGNQSLINGSILNIALLPSGTYDFYYVVKTVCAVDTTVATLTIFDASNAGNNGAITVCKNQLVDLLSGLSGSVILGGNWFNSANQSIPSSSIYASSTAGAYNYNYVAGNGVCPNDTAVVTVNVDGNCDWLNIDEMYFSSMVLYPNVSTGLVYISNTGSTDVFSYEVLDMSARLVAKKSDAITGSSTTAIDLSGKIAGMYMIRVYNGNAEKVFKVVLQ